MIGDCEVERFSARVQVFEFHFQSFIITITFSSRVVASMLDTRNSGLTTEVARTTFLFVLRKFSDMGR
jgi:hypothetical protein